MKSVVVTGVSTGIGRGATRVLAENGIHVFGTVRKQEDADALKKEFGDRVTPLILDVTDEAALRQAAAEVREKLGGEKLFGLVNNAGIAVSGPLVEINPDDVRTQLEVNVMGPLLTTQAFAPLLGTDPDLKGEPGRIVNISSVGGRRAFPFLGPYSASKFAVEGMSEALRRELMLFGIDVIVVAPGAVRTNIWDKAEEIDVTPYSNSPYLDILQNFQTNFVAQGRQGLKPEYLGEVILNALSAQSPKTRYEVSPDPFIQQMMTRYLPPRMLDKMIAKMLGLKQMK
ncbi:SDR family oxidoreductase [Parvibaculum sp. MBR-TMA-1.3b-4.2]|jgi:NAD(P)-dependent dehydrogenase (short-subunit alcohol dehydrogenase family)